jgi:integrase
MGVFERNGHFYIRYSANGRIIRKSIGRKGVITKTVARQVFDEEKRKARLGKLGLDKRLIPTLEAFSKEYITYQRDIKQKRSWFKDVEHLNRFCKELGNLKLSEINVKLIDDYKLRRVNEVKAVTVNRELEVLRHLFYLAKKWDKLNGENPVAKAGLFKTESQRMRILTPDEEIRLVNLSEPHLKPIIQTALMTGLRKGELLKLTWQDINFDTNILTIKAENSKSKKSRKIPISSALRKLLLEQKLKTGHSGFVFLTPNFQPYSGKNPGALKRSFSTALRRANIKGLVFHDLRHTCATRMAERGASIIAVKEILGHSDIKTTIQYFHPEKSLNEAVELVGISDASDSISDTLAKTWELTNRN